CAFLFLLFFFSSRRRHTRFSRDWSSDVCSSDLLGKELRRGSWGHETVALGTNTDPYQRAEGRYKLMPGIIRTLADSGTPMSILRSEERRVGKECGSRAELGLDKNKKDLPCSTSE